MAISSNVAVTSAWVMPLGFPVPVEGAGDAVGVGDAADCGAADDPAVGAAVRPVAVGLVPDAAAVPDTDPDVDVEMGAEVDPDTDAVEPFNAAANRSVTAACARIAALHAADRPGSVESAPPAVPADVPPVAPTVGAGVVSGADHTDGAVWVTDALGSEVLPAATVPEQAEASSTATARNPRRTCGISSRLRSAHRCTSTGRPSPW